ncbi:MAG: universal stress protein [Desulfovibrio sp.]|jgi:nucleotide-binding universal stress UspA family protein|nr:universal stress protein [Desulfovibrio sp.]
MYSKILVPVSAKNLEARARVALRHALALRPETLFLLHVTEPIPGLVGGQAHMRIMREQEEKGLEVLRSAMGVIENAPFALRVEAGTVAETIVRVAHEEQVDLIVMFTDGRDTLEDALLGSVTERVLRNSDVALLAIRR